MNIPSVLRHVIDGGKAVLLLGAGASMEARDSNGNHPPSGAQLAQRLADHFLGGTFRDSPLNQVAEYAISESDLVTVQSFIADLFSVFAPSSAHLALAARTWPGLATTNYDILVESAYRGTSSPTQNLVPFIDNSDRVLSPHDHDRVLYLKLHGCITRARITNPPFILTTDQYAQFEQGRSHVFQELLTWGREYSLVFIGQRIDDINFRDILLRLEADIPSRPRFFMVTPHPDAIVVRYWEKKRVGVLDGTFNAFMASL